MNFKNTMQIEKSQVQKSTRMIPLLWNVQNRQIYRKIKQIRSCLELKVWMSIDVRSVQGNCGGWWKCSKTGSWQWLHNCISLQKKFFKGCVLGWSHLPQWIVTIPFQFPEPINCKNDELPMRKYNSSDWPSYSLKEYDYLFLVSMGKRVKPRSSGGFWIENQHW